MESVLVISGAIIYIVSMRRGFSTFALSSGLVIAGFALLAVLSSGQLLTQALGTVGVSTWRFTLAIFAEFALGAFLAWIGPWLVARIRNRSREVEA